MFGNFFWIVTGILFVVVALGFKSFADERGWVLNWWKGLLAVVWYTIFTVSIYAGGILIGENENGAGIKMIIFGTFITLILGAGLWRVMLLAPKKA